MLINNFFNYILFKYKDFIEVYKSKLGYSKNLDLILSFCIAGRGLKVRGNLNLVLLLGSKPD